MIATHKTFRLALITSALLDVVSCVAGSTLQSRATDYSSVCNEIEGAISNASGVFYPGDSSYTSDVSHWVSSSTQQSACSVEPGSAEDIGKILQIIAQNGAHFAVKGGGHNANVGFSSTEGVHIAMTRFDDVVYNADVGTADVGAGLTWDTVYENLAQHNVNVVGGRVPGVGVAGLSLGGGYSWLTNEHGLTVDTIEAYELVLPNGTVTTVTSADDDLFFGLKGGFNNFGIVTKFTLKTFPQSYVWGGLMIFAGDQLDAIARATTNFAQNVTDPRAAIITGMNTLVALPGVTLNIFYNRPEPPAGIFDEFLNIPYLIKDVKTRSFPDLISATPSQVIADLRGAFHTVTLANYSSSILDAIVDQLKSVGANVTSLFESGILLSYDVEPFLPTLFTHGSDSAYPPSRESHVYPLNLFFAWKEESADDYFLDAIRQSAQAIEAAAIAEGQDVANAFLYGNYALNGTDLEKIYSNNLPRLREIKSKYDPNNVMGLAGGWKF